MGGGTAWRASTFPGSGDMPSAEKKQLIRSTMWFPGIDAAVQEAVEKCLPYVKLQLIPSKKNHCYPQNCQQLHGWELQHIYLAP